MPLRGVAKLASRYHFLDTGLQHSTAAKECRKYPPIM